jgi:hypothetical protein
MGAVRSDFKAARQTRVILGSPQAPEVTPQGAFSMARVFFTRQPDPPQGMVDRRERAHDDPSLEQFGLYLGEGDVRLRLDQRPHHVGVSFANRTPVTANGFRRGAPVSRTRRISFTAAEGLGPIDIQGFTPG